MPTVPHPLLIPREGVYAVTIRPRSLFGKTLRLPPSLNARQHWAMRAKWTREFLEETFYAVKKIRVPHLERIELTIYNLAVQETDYDNLAAAAKPLIDGIVLAGVIPEDDPKHLTRLILESQRVLNKVDEKLFLFIERAV